MNKKNIILLLCFVTAFAKGQTTFNQTYNFGNDAAFNFIEVVDGYITASMAGFPFYPLHMIVFKTDFNGDTVWSKQYGDTSEYLSIYSLVPLPDSTLIAGCHLYNFIENKYYVYLAKLTYIGDTIWTSKIASPPGFFYFSGYLTLTSDNGFLISGQIADDSISDGDGFILKADMNGNYLWHKTFGGPNFDQFYSSIELPDKGFLTLGWTRSFGFGNSSNRDVYLVKTDSMGNFEWQKTFGSSNFESDIGITACQDGNYLLAGVNVINSIDRAWIIKIDVTGAVIWQKTYNLGIGAEVWWARELTDYDIVAVASCTNASTQKDEGLILRTDSAGNLKWHRTFPMNNNHACFRDVRQTSDGGFICAGFCFTGASGNEDAWLVKLDSLGCDSAGCPTYYTGISTPPIIDEPELVIFPSPATDIVYVNVTGKMFADVFEITLFNAQGSQVIKRKFLNTGNGQPLYIGGLSKGLYLVRCEVEGKVYYLKFVKE